MSSVHGAHHSQGQQSTEESQPSFLVAPLATHGLLSDSTPGLEGLSIARNGFFHDSNQERQPRVTTSYNADLIKANDNLHGIADTISPTSTVARTHTQHTSLNQREPLIFNKTRSEDTAGGFEKHITSSTMPTASYPPASNSNTRVRKYKRIEQQPLQDTHFFLRGHLMTGGDNVWPLIGSVVLLLGLGGLWLGTTGVWIWRDGLGGGGAGKGGKAAVIIFGYLLGVCFGAMMATAFRDPGESAWTDMTGCRTRLISSNRHPT
jgi:hypothetical protein